VRKWRKKFASLSFYAISLIMTAIALLMTIDAIGETIDSEIFLGFGLILAIIAGLLK
jgi:hypothetical protein